MSVNVVTGLPGVSSVITATHRVVFRTHGEEFFAGGRIISPMSRDPGNTGDINVLRAGLIMGKITSTGTVGNFALIGGQWAPSIMGTLGAAYASGTSLTLTLAAATELLRRVGPSGTFKLTGPPTANGTVATATVTYSAIAALTGSTVVVTVTAIGAAFVNGSYVQPTDGTEDIKSFIPDGYGVNMFDASGSAVAQPFPLLPVKGQIYTASLIGYPTDTGLQAWLKGNLSAQGEGQFTFDDNY